MCSKVCEEQILGKPNGFLKLIFVIKECSNDWTKETDFRSFAINKMKELFEEHGVLECGQYFDIAIDYKFIIQDNKDINDKKKSKIRYVLKDDVKVDAIRDWFCFDCDILVDILSDQTHDCQYCWRVFHKKCSIQHNSDPINQDYKCAYCKRLDSDREGFIGQQKVDNKRLNTLIEYLLDFIKIQMKDNYNKFILNLDSNQRMIVFKEMDLKIMRNKAVMNKYKKLTEFENDFFLFMHNIDITSYDFESIRDEFNGLKLLYEKELKELRLCVDCYDRSNDKSYQNLNKDWFCEPCDPPHELRFVKVKHSPFWPAKVLKDYGDGKYNVRFFDKELKRMDVKIGQIFPIDDLKIRETSKRNNKLTEPLNMLDKYLNKLNDKMQNSGQQKLNICGEEKSDNAIKQSSSITTDSVNNNRSIMNLEKCIENVVQMAYERKSPRFKNQKTPNSKQSLDLSPKSTSIKKGADNSPSFKLQPPKLILPTRAVNKTSNSEESIGLSQSFTSIKSVPFNKTNDTSVPFLVVTESTVLSSIKATNNRPKRKRKSTFRTQIQSHLNDSEPNISKENVDKTQQMEIEMISETTNEANKEVIIAEVPLKALNTSDGESSTGSSQTQSMPNSMSSQSQNSNNSETEAEDNTEPQITPINDIHNQSSKQDVTNDSQQTVIDSQNTVCDEIEVQIVENETEKLVTDSTQIEFEESSKNINTLFDELLKSNETNPNVIKQKIICIKYYHENQIKALEEKFKKELFDTKKKNWCAVCQKSAKFYCCVRFYCSVDCQRNDWKNGHNSQCLTLSSNKGL